MEAHNDQHETLLRPLAILVALLVAGVVVSVWVGAARHGFEYDEIWTLQRYALAPSVGAIFSDLATPNNHPLHSLLVRLTTSLLGDSELAVRLPALLAGTLLFVCMPFAMYCLTRRWEVVLLATAWIAASAPLLHFSQRARGYSLQTLLVFAYTMLVLRAYQERDREGRMLTAAAVLGAGAMLVLPTAVLFLLPVALIDIAARAKRWRKNTDQQRGRFLTSETRALVAHTVLGLWCAGWILHGSEGLTEGWANFGTTISSVSQWTVYCNDVIGTLGLRLGIILAVVGLFCCVIDRTLWTLNAAIFFPLLAAWLLRAGPARAYVPLVPLVCTAGAIGLYRAIDLVGRKAGRRPRWIVVIIAAGLPALALPSAMRDWSTPDWKQLVGVVREKAGPTACIIYPDLDTYVIQHYYAPDILLESLRRLPSGSASTLVLTEIGGRMTGVDIAAGRSGAIVCPARLCAGVHRMEEPTLELTSYWMARLPAGFSPGMIEPRSVYFALVGPAERELSRMQVEQLYVDSGRGQWLLLNPHLPLLMSRSNTMLQAFLLATTNADALVRQSANSAAQNAVPMSFYQLVPAMPRN